MQNSQGLEYEQPKIFNSAGSPCSSEVVSSYPEVHQDDVPSSKKVPQLATNIEGDE